MNKLDNKIAVVTGASKGIGAAIAKQMAAAGATVVVNYASSRAGAEKVVGEIVAAGGKAVAIGADVAVESEVARLFEAVKEQFGRVDVLVNNAGIYNFAPLEAITPESYRQIYDINVLGLLLVSKAASPLFPASGGAIVNLSSVVSTMAPPTALIYASSKAAVDAITRSMAKELAGRNIRVNAINPGMIVTEGLVAAGIPDSDLEKHLLSITPLGRAGQPDEVALPAVFLASDDARYITGETLRVGGGSGM
ncbi:SDR family NAD(P)-dependent oxidoreductase [Rugamonas sp.]|uniref:SDR family NAD(P)-dependent oxidoreductase n=1 Tax=Rugamonas sp. TaxID=1926287 RepID=UPI0025F50E94|nr:glucose 1-dehydrogenase [Rugamonas sp.]